MATALKRYLACLGAVCALMATYCAAIAPLLEPPPHGSLENTRPEEAAPNVWWQHLFAADAWQNDNPMLLQTEQGTLLFKSLDPIGPNQWRLAPLTLIVPMSREAKGAVVGDLTAANKLYRDSPLAIVVAQDGADIQFREAPDWPSGSTPPLTNGLLRGPIEITGIDPRDNAGPQWSIKTANLRIDRRHVWTNNEVQITAGNSLAIGKDLSIFMKQDLFGPTEDDSEPWGLLDHMKLIYVKQVSMVLPPGGLWKDMKLGPESTAAAHAQTPARVELTCLGSFTFDFNKSIARLEDHIRVEHRFQNDLVADEFLCHQLEATFTLPDKSLPVDPTAVMVGPMQLKMVDAMGVDATGPLPAQSTVQITAPNILTQLTAKHLQVQLDRRQFTIDSPTSVMLNYMGNKFRAQSLEYAADPNDKHLGWLFASGPDGEVETDAASEFGRATARWQKSLKMQPTQAGELITLDGRALVEADARGHLASDHIDITLARLPPTSFDARAAAKSPKAEYQVDRLDAGGEVIMGNQAQTVRVGQLHVQFIYPQKQVSPSNIALSDSSGRPMIQMIGPPGNPAAPGTSPLTPYSGATAASPQLGSVTSSMSSPMSRPDSAQTPPPIGLPAATRPNATRASSSDPLKSPTGDLPVLIIGKELHSRVIVTSEQSWIDHLQISGPVVISRDAPPQPGDPAWRIEGGQLQLASGASGQVDLQIVGEPARITFGEGYIEGPVIRLDQRTGLVWMDHPGEICVPGNIVASRTEGQNIEWLKPLKCRWQGHMLFNGTKANIEGDITIDGCARTAPDRLLFIGGSCDALEILMTKPVDISHPGATTATAHSLTMRRKVNIRTAQRDTSNRRLSLEEISLPELTYEVATNRVIGSGPGWLRSQHVSRAGGIGAMASTSKDSRLPTPGSQVPALQGMHLKFRDTMEARLTEKQLSFSGKVEVGIGPVRSLEEIINLDTMRTLQPEQTLLSGDLLRVYDASDISRAPSTSTMAEGAWEFEATGNVAFEGKRETGDFAGKAYRMTYAQAKDLVHIRGDGRVPAELQVKPQSSSMQSVLVKLWSGSLNTKTMRPSGDAADGQLELAPGSQVVPRAAVGNGNPKAPAAPPVNPRDAANELFKRN